MKLNRLLIIIPAYNEGKNICQVVDDINKNATFADYVIINDGSKDDTKEICDKYQLNAVHLPVNLGIGGAVQTGYMYAERNGYEYAVQIDGDGQHDVSFLKKMYDCIKSRKINMVIGSRFIEGKGFQSTFMRRVGIRFFSGIIHLFTKVKITDPTSGLRMIDKGLIHDFAQQYPKDYPEPESIVYAIKRKNRIMELPVVMRERQSGESSISPLKSVYYMIKVTLAIFFELMRKES